MCKVIAIANQKGGVGKTTLTANLGAGLSKSGKRVLTVDFDSQGNLSNYLGYEKDENPTINNILLTIVGGAYISYEKENEYSQEECDMMSHLYTDFHKSVRHNTVDNIDYIPSDITLAGADIYLVGAICREKILDIALSYFKDEYDYILIDCPPSLGMFLSNALTASDELIIPVQAENWAVDGLAQIINSFKQIKRNLNPKLTLNGLLLNMTNDTKICKEITDVLSEQFGELLYKTQIRRSIKATASTIEQKSMVNDVKNKLGEMYIQFTKEFLAKEVK